MYVELVNYIFAAHIEYRSITIKKKTVSLCKTPLSYITPVHTHGGCRVGEVRDSTTSPMLDHKDFKLQKPSRDPPTSFLNEFAEI